jgi:UPF0148 protein
MADLLRQGATLTELACPVCASPLFKLKDKKLWCEQCKKRVVVVEEVARPTETMTQKALLTLESTILTKIKEVEEKIKIETNTEKLHNLSSILATLLVNLEKIKKIKEN